jgi:hypothetical protein
VRVAALARLNDQPVFTVGLDMIDLQLELFAERIR